MIFCESNSDGAAPKIAPSRRGRSRRSPISSPAAARTLAASARDLRRDTDCELAITIGERRSVNLFQLNRAADHAGLPGVVLGIVLELGHDFLGKQFERLADRLMGVLAGLIEQNHLVDMRGAEAPQLLGDCLGRADEAAAQCGLLGFWILPLPPVVFVPHVDRARRRALPVLRLAVIA